MSSSSETPRLVDGPSAAAASLLLAHGAGAPMDSPFMAAMATGLADLGWRVVRFEFPYMARQRLSQRKAGPDRLPVLQQCFREQVALEAGQGPLVIGGKSMGGRIASLLVDELAQQGEVQGCLCLGYPFHPPGKPEQLRTEHLARQQVPTLILQGERDTFGKRAEVQSYTLSPQVQVQWLPHGDHSFKPTKASGLKEADNWRSAIEQSHRFLQRIVAAAAAAGPARP